MLPDIDWGIIRRKKFNASCIFCNVMYCDYCGGCTRTLVDNEAPFQQHFAQEYCNGNCRHKAHCPNHQDTHFRHFLGPAAKSWFRHMPYCKFHLKPLQLFLCVCVRVRMRVHSPASRKPTEAGQGNEMPKGPLNRPHPLVKLESSALR